MLTNSGFHGTITRSVHVTTVFVCVFGAHKGRLPMKQEVAAMPVFLPRESDSEKPGESANALHKRHE